MKESATAKRAMGDENEEDPPAQDSPLAVPEADAGAEADAFAYPKPSPDAAAADSGRRVSIAAEADGPTDGA